MLFCWEAFVSGRAHSDTHVYDAATAATCFSLNERNLAQANAVTAERPLSLIGTVALWSGWTDDLAILHNSTLVIMLLRNLTKGRWSRHEARASYMFLVGMTSLRRSQRKKCTGRIGVLTPSDLVPGVEVAMRRDPTWTRGLAAFSNPRPSPSHGILPHLGTGNRAFGAMGAAAGRQEA